VTHPTSSSADALKTRCARIELLVLDVDGVLTDGVIALDDRGVETKHFHVRDGAGIALWRRAGKRVAILSGRRARVVDLRAAELGIAPVVQGAAEKRQPFLELLRETGCPIERVAYMGDDLADLPVLTLPGLGLACCPADAAPEVLAVSHLAARPPGGRGAVRDVVERILVAQDRWAELASPPADQEPERAA
jgi:3-deoxy-D-manno-octulosonate 8-phosphate phosphatase (KDO 8-P phosphatase)